MKFLIVLLFLLQSITTLANDLYCNGQEKKDYADRLYYPNGQLVKDYADRFFYPNGQIIQDYAGRVFYPNGQIIQDYTDSVFYPNGQIITDYADRNYYPNGQIVTDYAHRNYYPNGQIITDYAGRNYYPDGTQIESDEESILIIATEGNIKLKANLDLTTNELKKVRVFTIDDSGVKIKFRINLFSEEPYPFKFKMKFQEEDDDSYLTVISHSSLGPDILPNPDTIDAICDFEDDLD